MNYTCVLKFNCLDGEIQIVIGTENQTAISSISTMTLVNSNCELQSKLTDIYGIIKPPIDTVFDLSSLENIPTNEENLSNEAVSNADDSAHNIDISNFNSERVSISSELDTQNENLDHLNEVVKDDGNKVVKKETDADVDEELVNADCLIFVTDHDYDTLSINYGNDMNDEPEIQPRVIKFLPETVSREFDESKHRPYKPRRNVDIPTDDNEIDVATDTEIIIDQGANLEDCQNDQPFSLNTVNNLMKSNKRKRMHKSNTAVKNLLPKGYFIGIQAKMLKDLESDYPFKCAVCFVLFETLSKIRTHVKDSHPDYLSASPFACKYCSKSFTEESIVKHFYCHTKPFLCPHCNKRFSDRGNLIRHLLYVNGIFNEICSVCGFQCVSEHELKSHSKTHETLLTHQCPVCGKLVARASQLNRHISTHNTSRDYQCMVCNKRYKSMTNCRIHMKTHNSNRERKYQCHICNKAYYKNINLKKHNERNHSDQERNIIGQIKDTKISR